MRFLFMFLVLCAPCFGDDLTDGKVFEAVADYGSDIAEVEKSNHAMVARGTRTAISTRLSGVLEQSIIWISAREGQSFLEGRALETSSGRLNQLWVQRLVDSSGVYYRKKMGGSQNSQIDAKVDKENSDLQLARASGFQPVHPIEYAALPGNVVHSGGHLYKRGQMIETLMSNDLKLAKFDSNGDIISEWIVQTRDPNTTNEIKIVWGKKSGFRPVEAYSEMVVNGKKKYRVRLGQTNTTWAKEGKRWLPVRIEADVMNRSNTLYDVEIRWKFSNPKSLKLVDRTQDDWDSPIRKLFGEAWQTKGDLPVLGTSDEG